MKFSIAMCTYNGGLHLQEQLDSIAAQTRLPDELVVCDDRSGDNTREIIEVFASRSAIPVRLYINESKLGSTKNFEKAIGLCEGEIVALSDQDDVWHPEKLMRIENVFSSAPSTGLVFTDAEVVDESLQPLGYRLWNVIRFSRTQRRLIDRGRAFEVLLLQNVVTGATMAFRSKFKELLLPIPCNGILFHDGWIALMIAAIADLAFIQEPLIMYRQHSKQQIGTAIIGFRFSLNKAKQVPSIAHLAQADQFGLVYDRLLSNRANLHHKEVISQLEAKIAHLRTRGGMPDSRLRRVPLIIQEILRLHYHRYSSGMYSAAKDFLL